MGVADAQDFFAGIIWDTVVDLCNTRPLKLDLKSVCAERFMSGWSLKFWRGYCLIKLPLHGLSQVGLAQRASVLEAPVP